MKPQTDRKKLMIARAVSIVWKSSRVLTITNLILTILQGLLPLIPLYLMKLLIDSIEKVASGADAPAFGYIAFLIGVMGAVALLSATVKAVAGIVEKTQSIVVTDYMQDILHKKSIDVDLAYYEDPRFYDTLHRAQSEAPFRPTSIVNAQIRGAQSCVSLLAMTGLLLTFHWFIAVVLIAAAVPGVLVKLKFSKITWKWQRQRTETERRAWYKHWLLTSVEHAKELRLFGLGEHFRDRYRDLRNTLRKEKLGIFRRRALADLGTQTVATLLVYGSFAFIAWQAFKGLITIGGMVMYFQAFQRGLGYLRGLLGSLADLYEGNLFLTNLFDFLDITPAIIDPPEPQRFPSPIRNGISFDKVSFTYPSSSLRAIDNVSLNIRKGEMLALVGENGSGKTTLVKLLCRLYDPDSGTIGIDETSLKEFAIENLREHISVIFQDYARYHLTAEQNISIGDIGNIPHMPDVRKAAVTAGADEFISNLPEGYDTHLGRLFKTGTELSIGEWQKIALARAFVRNSQIVILDEPTSALDARSERNLFTRFRELAYSKTSIVISHRFSSVRMADRIAVMHGGRIIELGTHEELLAGNGKYREMYTIQSSAYN